MKLKRVVLTGLVVASCVAQAEWGQAPNGEFWNERAKRFIYAPAFPFKDVDGASRYRYDVLDDRHVLRTFRADTPRAGLAGIWQDLPVGYVTVMCFGESANGATLGEAGRRTFWKKSAFTGNYPPAKRSYALARSKIFDCFLSMPQLRSLAETGRPDLSYPLNGYPSKMLSAEIRAIVVYYKWQTGKGVAADGAAAHLETAKKAADYLIADSVPAGQPLEHFPRTYAKEGSEYGRFVGEQDIIMLVYPAGVGGAFLDLASVCGDAGAKYSDAAKRIAETYLALQGEDGTWWLKQNAITGKETCANRLLPIGIVTFLEKMYDATKDDRYRTAADRAFAYIDRKPMVDWNWEGQFEDVKNPNAKRWTNLSKHPACSVAMYLVSRFPGDKRRLAQAEDLLKFSEDQFVEWTPPYDHGRGQNDPAGPDDGTWNYFCRPASTWVTPCALEQYGCYYPIDASAAKFINTYIALWKATKKDEYLAKARALGDTATRMQEDDGFINTWWCTGASRNDYRYHTWINCMLATAAALDNLAQCDEQGKGKRK